MENPLYTLPSEQPNLTEEQVRAIVYSMMQNFDGTIKAAAGNVTIRGNSANIIKQDSSNVYGVSATGSDAYLARYNPPIVAYTDGLRLSFKADVANTGAATFTADDLTAKDIRKNGTSALVTGDIVAGQQVDIVYDTTNGWWQLQTPSSALVPTTDMVKKVFVDVVTAGTAVNNATTTVFSGTIPANTYTANSQMRVFASFNHTGNAVLPNRTFNFKYGGTTIASYSNSSTGVSENLTMEFWLNFGSTGGTCDFTYMWTNDRGGTITRSYGVTRAMASATLTSDQTWEVEIVAQANATGVYYAHSVEKI